VLSWQGNAMLAAGGVGSRDACSPSAASSSASPAESTQSWQGNAMGGPGGQALREHRSPLVLFPPPPPLRAGQRLRSRRRLPSLAPPPFS